jgi:hypothetical protein
MHNYISLKKNWLPVVYMYATTWPYITSVCVDFHIYAMPLVITSIRVETPVAPSRSIFEFQVSMHVELWKDFGGQCVYVSSHRHLDRDVG